MIKKGDIPAWADSGADAESLYAAGWTADKIEKSISDWQAFIEDNPIPQG